jgi:putative DNA primase/helicase
MLAPVVDAGGKFRAVHITWLDLELAGGKAIVVNPESGETLPSKKVCGSNAGNVIRLVELAGRAVESVLHPSLVDARGRPRRVLGARPDMAEPGIVIPAEVERLVLLGDGDSDPFTRRLAPARAVARYARPGLAIVGAFAPDGGILTTSCSRRPSGEVRGKVGWQTIVAIIDAAAPIEAPEIPHAERAEKSGRRKAHADRDSADEAVNGASQVVAGASAALGPLDAASSSAVAPGAPASALVAGENVVDFPRSSNKGEPAEHTSAADGAGGEPPREASAGASGDAGGDGLDLRLAFFAHTDLGNAERFRERNRGKFLWSPATGWLCWNGRFWERDVSGRVRAAAHAVVRAIQDEAEALRASGRDVQVGTRHKGKSDEAPIMMSDSLAAWGRASEHSARLGALAEQAEPYLHVAPAKLDGDPFKVNVANGTLVVRRDANSDYVALRPHHPDDLMTKCSPVIYDPAAQCPIFDRFFAEVQPSAEVRRFLMRWQGLSLTGDVSEQKLAVFWGGGKNGKSTFIDICAHVGGDYSKTVPIETFLNDGRGRAAGQASPDLAMLPGVRHLRTSEPERNAKLAEALIKLATGGEPILARHLRKDYLEFYPQFKLTMSGNHRPSISGADEGIWRRVIFVPWPVTISDDKVDRQLSEKLRAETSGILNRLLDGLRDWLDNGLRAPDDVLNATADYRRDSDPCGQFLEECVISAPGKRVRSTDMHVLFAPGRRPTASANGRKRDWQGRSKTDGVSSPSIQTECGGWMWS